MRDRETGKQADPLIIPYENFSPEVFSKVLPQWDVRPITYSNYSRDGGRLISRSPFGWEFIYRDGSDVWDFSIYERRRRETYVSPAGLRLRKTQVPKIELWGWEIAEAKISEADGVVEFIGPRGTYKIEQNGLVHTVVSPAKSFQSITLR